MPQWPARSRPRLAELPAEFRKMFSAALHAAEKVIGGKMSRPYRYVPCDEGSKHYVGFSDNPDAIPERADCPFCGKNVPVTFFHAPGKTGRYGGQLRAHNTDQRVYL